MTNEHRPQDPLTQAFYESIRGHGTGSPWSTPLPIVWLRDPELWKDVFKNVITTAIIAGITFVFAVMLGYVKTPDTRLIGWYLVIATPIIAVGMLLVVASAIQSKDIPTWARVAQVGVVALLLVGPYALVLVNLIDAYRKTH